MAATAEKVGDTIAPGGNGEYVEYGYITFDSDATVEVPTSLGQINTAVFTPAGSGGNAATLSIDETITGGVYYPSGGFVTVDATASVSTTWQYRFYGH